VSLLPSATEIVAALGFEDSLVGRSHECDFPSGVERLPVCTEPKIDVTGSSEKIHRGVQKLLSESLSVYRVDAEKLRQLFPTHVVTQVQCEVCAVSLADVEQALEDWSPPRPLVVPLNPQGLGDVFSDIERVADALGAHERGTALVRRLRRRMDAVARKVRGSGVRPRVAAIEWLSPLMAAGNWIPELIEMAGGENLFGRAGDRSPWLTWDELRAADPDVVIFFPCGFSLNRLRAEIDLVTRLPGWKQLSAARSGRVFLAEGSQLFNRPGPRLAETLEALAQMLLPRLFSCSLEGNAWERLIAGC
jgi:iron complex transport system substrate-binding protein